MLDCECSDDANVVEQLLVDISTKRSMVIRYFASVLLVIDTRITWMVTAVVYRVGVLVHVFVGSPPSFTGPPSTA